MNEKKSLYKAEKILLDVMFYLGILCVLAVPYLARRSAAEYYGYGVGWSNCITIVYMVMLLLSGCCAVYILYNLRRIFRSLLGGNSFTMENTIYLQRIAAACAVIAAVYIVKCFLIFSAATVVIVFVFMIGGLFSLTLRNVFAQAVAYKEENDWTV